MTKIGNCRILTLYLILFGGFDLSAQFVLLDSALVSTSKQSILAGTTSSCAEKAFEALLNRADVLLDIKNPTVLDKGINPPTGDKHDYLSISRYWWPDPQSSDGLPWIRKDGETNPDTQTDAVDRRRLGTMTSGIRDLSLAYYFTEKETYAEKAISMISTWFLDEETRMNPHLQYAQSVPGNPNSRRSGILDGRSIALNIPDAMHILADSPHWASKHQDGMVEWLSKYLTWLTKSDLGKAGSQQENNHGSWYKVHVGVLAYFLDKHELAREMVTQAQESLDDQLNAQGGQPHELARTRSFFYSCFNLRALLLIARLGDHLGMDMWHYESRSGRSLALAIDYLLPVIDGGKWPHPTRGEIDLTDLMPILHPFSEQIMDNKYSQALHRVLAHVEIIEIEPGSKFDRLREQCLLDGLEF